ncbi:PaaI family thioesterase [Mumia zhuanghuii]|uniref:Acyl-coenzyme A thioesterase THEM4 n=2 Tax=Mumia TaxID=1546255 RepID=A0ABW1QHK6_9ACTN|nr:MULTISPECIES: PaaI family thioesterase [Mumia]KAA1423039.1 PaaI family thioesterase [Mumia zhuanghuii]
MTRVSVDDDNRIAVLSPHWKSWAEAAIRQMAPGWQDMTASLGSLQDTLAGAVPPEDVVEEATVLMERARALLEPYEVSGSEQIFGRLLTSATRGQTFSPPLWVDRYEDDELAATTRFGRFHAGNNGVVHGGAIALMFDDALGVTSDLGGRERSRTASLKVDFRSLTPLDRVLEVRVRLTHLDGRKRTLHGTLSDGGRVCAEATGLFIELRPEQQ